jgi:cellulose synthase/poly-beta-1,6-N-acetylglucosamine synthase-like glycosyltransferase
MLRTGVIYSALSLLISSAALFLWGHKLRFRHWAVSQLTNAGVAACAWVLLRAVSGPTPMSWPLVATLTVGTLITVAWEDWNPLGHASFTAVVLTVATFLAYALFVVATAHLGPFSLFFATLFLFLQALALAFLVVYSFEILDVMCRTRWNRAFDSKIVPGYYPKVSLHVPTHNEPPELVIETLNALSGLDYPNFEVLVIDNNTFDESLWRPVEAHCARLGPRFRFFHLLPWPGFKSGALNYALDHTASDAEIIGIVDADYLVDARYLKELVGHFNDPAVAFVQTPQDYRDVQAQGRYGRALYLSYLYFFEFSMPCRNERNGIIFAGTMGLIRRQALEAVGRWDEWCITEDAEVSIRLLKAGYQSIYIARSYGRGLMPLDYAGLKKQRFRWAFGGMQLLRMHARALLDGRAAGSLTLAQRFAYLSGGLQWLSDPMSVAFTTTVLIAAGALIAGGSVFLQPLAAGTVLVPPLLVAFGVARFIWAFRARVRCTWREAWDSFTILLGLTWVVSLACVRGLTSREGVFLRTPKQSERLQPMDTIRVVWIEMSLAMVCLVAAIGVAVSRPMQPLSASGVLFALLIWQMVIFASAVRSSIWNYRACRTATDLPGRSSFRTVGHRLGLFDVEWKLARSHALAAGGAVALFYVAVLFAPTIEQVWRLDPLDRFIAVRTLLPARGEEAAAVQLVREADAVQRQDLDAVLALWDPRGVIKDDAFTPDVAGDDRVWSGIDGIRQRYREEFERRQYKELRHEHLTITSDGKDRAVIVNDLDAVIEVDRRTDHIRLSKTDRWTLVRRAGQWRIVMLETNMAPTPPEPSDGLLRTAARK